jgi:hypothetical protein
VGVTCADLDRALESGDPELRVQLERHAADCVDCREQLAAWEALSIGAGLLRERWDSPGLWGRIEAAMKDEAPRRAVRHPGFRILPFRLSWRRVLPLAAAAALLVFLPLAWNAMKDPGPGAQDRRRRLLSEDALEEVERSEKAYIRSIERLSELAGPALETSDSPLAMNYREKLKLIDSAIAECRAQADSNPFNAHLRAELLSMYQEKQRTLKTVLEESQGDL